MSMDLAAIRRDVEEGRHTRENSRMIRIVDERPYQRLLPRAYHKICDGRQYHLRRTDDEYSSKDTMRARCSVSRPQILDLIRPEILGVQMPG